MRVALATAAEARGLDEDEPALLDALSGHGVEAVAADWHDPAVDWTAFGLVVVRSTWDYATRRDAFLGWAERVSSVTRLANPAGVLRANTDKRYLRALEAAGVPVVPTLWVPAEPRPGEPPAGHGSPDPASWPGGEVVVKPAVSAGGRDTARYPSAGHPGARAHVARLRAEGRTVMVQPYLPAAEQGEVALIYLAGSYSHAVRRVVRLSSGGDAALFAAERLSPSETTPAQRALADRALALLVDDPDDLLYARVDVVQAPDGRDVLMEVELTEPSLYLAYAAGATERLAAAIAAAAGRPAHSPR